MSWRIIWEMWDRQTMSLILSHSLLSRTTTRGVLLTTTTRIPLRNVVLVRSHALTNLLHADWLYRRFSVKPDRPKYGVCERGNEITWMDSQFGQRIWIWRDSRLKLIIIFTPSHPSPYSRHRQTRATFFLAGVWEGGWCFCHWWSFSWYDWVWSDCGISRFFLVNCAIKLIFQRETRFMWAPTSVSCRLLWTFRCTIRFETYLVLLKWVCGTSIRVGSKWVKIFRFCVSFSTWSLILLISVVHFWWSQLLNFIVNCSLWNMKLFHLHHLIDAAICELNFSPLNFRICRCWETLWTITIRRGFWICSQMWQCWRTHWSWYVGVFVDQVAHCFDCRWCFLKEFPSSTMAPNIYSMEATILWIVKLSLSLLLETFRHRSFPLSAPWTKFANASPTRCRHLRRRCSTSPTLCTCFRAVTRWW